MRNPAPPRIKGAGKICTMIDQFRSRPSLLWQILLGPTGRQPRSG